MKENFKGVLPIITGSSGLIGSAIAKKLTDIGQFTIGIDLIKSKINSEYFLFIKDEFFSNNIYKTIKDYIKSENSIKTISIIHLAAIDSKYGLKDKRKDAILGDDIDSNLESMLDVNLKQVIVFSKGLINFCNMHKIKLNLILTPSLYAYVAPDPLIYNNFNHENISKQKSLSYVVSKSSLPSITRFLSATYSSNNHRFNCFVPHGVINNPDPLFVKSFINKSPMRRLPEINEIIEPSLFLMSNASSYMNGQSLIIDGGWSII